MKPLFLAIPVLISMAVCGSHVQGVPAAGNLLKNPDFEANEGLPQGWYWEAKLVPKGTATVETAGAKKGRLGLILRPTRANATSDEPLAVGQLIPAAPYRGKTLHVSGWVKADRGSRAVVAVYLLGKSFMGGARLASSSEEPGFVFDQNSVDVPASGAVENIVVLCAVSGTSGAAYFDDLCLSTQAPAIPPAKPRDKTAFKASIRVDAGKVIRTIPKGLFGTNIEWSTEGNKMWDTAKGQWKPELVQLAKELGPTHIRFPGGTFSDFYHWRDSIGPAAERPWTPPMPGQGVEKHWVGTNEAIDLVNKLSSSLLITANAGTGTPEEAAEWVRYVGKKAPVTLWEIGNEVYIHDDSPAAKASGMTEEAYAAKCSQMIDAMRTVDPTIKISAITDENYVPWVANKEWTKTVLNRVGDRIDFLSLHCGYAPIYGGDIGERVRDVYRALFAAPIAIDQALARADRAIAALPAKDADRIKIAVTEWGPLFQIAPDGHYVDHCKTLGSTLFMASVMKRFVERPRVTVASQFRLSDPLFIGMIGYADGKPVPNPSYYLLQRFARIANWRVVQSQTNSPTYDSPQIGWVPAQQDVSWLESLAAISPDGKHLTLVAINRQFDRPAKVGISISGFEAQAEAKVWTLTGDAVDAHGKAELFSFPGFKWAKQAEDGPGPKEIHMSTKTERLGDSGYVCPPLSVSFIELTRQ